MNVPDRDRADSAASAAPLSVGPDCWMVGHRNPGALLQCNTYLRTLEGAGGHLNVCVDPGSVHDFPAVEQNISGLIGDLDEVDVFSLNHQDPDVVGNSPRFCDANPHVTTLVTEDVWRLVRHLAFTPGEVRFTNTAASRFTDLGRGHRWQAVATPFCHFRGAMALYDPEIRTLFTGDLFGGFNQLGRVHLFAESSDWHGIAQFHQIYMPSREVLRYAVRQIQAIDPAVEVIAPQHGHVIVGDRIEEFLERMHELLVGLDLLAAELDDRYLKGYREVLEEMIQWAIEMMGDDEVERRLLPEFSDDQIEPHLTTHGVHVGLKSEGYSVLAKVFRRLVEDESVAFAITLRGLTLGLCAERDLPVPPIGVGVEEG